jgi:hypothetical protein
MQKTVNYLHLLPDGDLPHMMDQVPFLAIVIADEEVSQMEASRWLVDAGSRVLLAWGKDAEAWADAVQEAGQEAFNYEDIPDDRAVLTTAHDGEEEDLEEVFWFARHRAAHPVCTLNKTLIVHVAASPQREALEAAWSAA